jgi:hypothetical protein
MIVVSNLRRMIVAGMRYDKHIVQKHDGKNHFDDLELYGDNIKMDRKYTYGVRLWTAFTWLSIGTSDGVMWTVES